MTHFQFNLCESREMCKESCTYFSVGKTFSSEREKCVLVHIYWSVDIKRDRAEERIKLLSRKT